jgi:hypothetical protein
VVFDESDYLRAACGPDERRELVPLAKRLAELARCASDEGLLALGRYLDDPDADFATAIKELLAEGQQRILPERLRAGALAGAPRGAALLRRIMIAEAAIDLDAGAAPAFLELKALALLGAEVFFPAKREMEVQAFVDAGIDRGTAEAFLP